jgi:dTDP-4-dehydrorhamnose reductase
MLGSMLVRRWAAMDGVDLYWAGRTPIDRALADQVCPESYDLNAMTFGGSDLDGFVQFLLRNRISTVVNCIGLIKQQQGGQDPVSAIAINALFPHLIAKACTAANARMIHVSTDCVFSGSKGHYRESDLPDSIDFYGRSKALGEVVAPHLTLRTSIIGPELSRAAGYGLLAWFWSQRTPQIAGYDRAIFSGLTTLALADLMFDILLHHPQLQGLYHAASAAIDKYTLLTKTRDHFGMSIDIQPDSGLNINRSLNGQRLDEVIGHPVPDWDTQLVQLRDFMLANHIKWN